MSWNKTATIATIANSNFATANTKVLVSFIIISSYSSLTNCARGGGLQLSDYFGLDC